MISVKFVPKKAPMLCVKCSPERPPPYVKRFFFTPKAPCYAFNFYQKDPMFRVQLLPKKVPMLCFTSLPK